MAKASWAVVNPSSGSGNKSVNVSSSAAHTGRTARQTTLTITAANVTPKYVTVNQAGKPEFTENTSDTATAVQGGQTVTISGKSNSSKLTFTLGTGDLAISLPSTYTAGGLSVSNGAAITGDLGASAEFDWSISFTVAANTSISEKSRQIIVTDNAGNTDTCQLTQAAGAATLEVKKNGVAITSIDIDWEGTAVSFDVESNTSWSIS
jgi:hypothetical protein